MVATKSLVLLIASTQILTASAFVAPATCTRSTGAKLSELFEASESGEKQEPVSTKDEDFSDVGASVLEQVEAFGKGSAKAKRGRRKGTTAKKSVAKQAATLAPEEVFYEGPPAITETIIPTISIFTIIGIIPCAAAWARQAWVTYKVTTRRIRVTSGVGGKDMAEIVYPDINEIRSAKRLFGDGDLVAFLSDGAKFEMRNIPNFDETMEFVLKQVDEDVAKKYREQGDITTPAEPDGGPR